MRDVGIVDVYRHMEGAPLRGAFPVVVQFKVIKLTGKIIKLIWRILFALSYLNEPKCIY